jgi:hypothetical protein
VLHFVPLEARKRTLGALLWFSSAERRLLALVTAVPLAASVIKLTAPVAYGRSAAESALIPFPRPF